MAPPPFNYIDGRQCDNAGCLRRDLRSVHRRPHRYRQTGPPSFFSCGYCCKHQPEKAALFSLVERQRIIRDAVGGMRGVSIDSFDGLLVDYMHQRGARVVIRGLRALSDFEYEFQMALMNRKLNEEIETVFLMPHEQYSYLSSRLVKEVALLGGDVSQFVTPMVERMLKERIGSR